MEIQEILKRVDHTLLSPTATWEEIRQTCGEAARYHTASVCIPPCFVRRAADCLEGRVPVCTVVGFPNGSCTTAAKAFEAREALRGGAEEIDMVINLGLVKEQKWDAVICEIRRLKSVCQEHVLKVIIEACLLTEDEKRKLCELVTLAEADFIKTSTGFSTGGATFADVELLHKNVGPKVRVKASGGIATLEDAVRFLELGASRLGTSRMVRLAQAAEPSGVQA